MSLVVTKIKLSNSFDLRDAATGRLAQDVVRSVLGRTMIGDAMVLPRGTQALLGAIPLEYLDLVVAPRTGDVIPNPAHPDGPVYRI